MADIPQALLDAEAAGLLPPGSPGAEALDALRAQADNPWPSPDEASAAPRGPTPDGGQPLDLTNRDVEGAPRGPVGVDSPAVTPFPIVLPEALLSAERAGLLPAGSAGARALEALRAAGGERPATGPESRPFPTSADATPGAFGSGNPKLPTIPAIAGAVGNVLGGAVGTVAGVGGALGDIAGAIKNSVVGVLNSVLPTITEFALGLASAAEHALTFLADNLADAADFAGALSSGLYTALDELLSPWGASIVRTVLQFLSALVGPPGYFLDAFRQSVEFERTI